MAENVLKRFEELIEVGAKLVPLGGFDFSGYNARLQKKYSEWRKSCLELFEHTGPIGYPYKNKITSDQNGQHFYQTSAVLIQNSLRELYEKLKLSPELLTAPTSVSIPNPEVIPQTSTETTGVKILKPPQKKVQQTKVEQNKTLGKKVYVIGDSSDPLLIQLSDLLKELGIEEIGIERNPGQPLALDSIEDNPDVQYAFFVVSSQDIANVMFELGHFTGKLGKGRVMVLHMTDVNFPNEVPGVTVKPIVVKIEEASFVIIKELKTAGYSLNI